MFIIVLLPEPDGPTIARNSPRLDVEVDVAQRGDRDVAHVVRAADAAQADDRLGGRVVAAPYGAVARSVLTAG